MNRNFDRKFCMFKQESDAYIIDKKGCQGNCVLEIRGGKGKLSVYIQGLKPLQDATYRIYMIAADQNQALGVSACLVNVNDTGKGETKWNFNPDNVGNSGKAVEDFNIIALLVKGTGSELIAPMVCYMEKEVIWKKGFKEFQQGDTVQKSLLVAEKKPEPPVQQPVEQNGQKKNETVAEKQYDEQPHQPMNESGQPMNEPDEPIGILEPVFADNPAASDIIAEIPGGIENNNDGYNETEAAGLDRQAELAPGANEQSGTGEQTAEPVVESKETDSVYATAKDFFGEFPKPDNAIHENFREQMRECEENFDAVLEKADKLKKGYQQIVITYEPETDWDYLYNNNPPMSPFVSQHDINWVRIDYKDMYLLPVDLWVVSNHPFVVGSYNYYKHFILGKRVADGKMFFGIPDAYQMGYVDRAKEMGFTAFQSCDGSTAEDGSYGYWVMEV